MALELDLLHREDRPGAVPIVLKRRVVNNQLAIEPNRNLLANHPDAERVPRANLIVSNYKSLVGILLVVVETS